MVAQITRNADTYKILASNFLIENAAVLETAAFVLNHL